MCSNPIVSVCTFWILPSLCQDAACKALMVDRVWNDGFYWHPKTLQTNLESILPFPSTGFTCIQELFTDQNIRLQGLDGLWGVKWQILLALHPEAVRDIWLILLLFKTHEGKPLILCGERAANIQYIFKESHTMNFKTRKSYFMSSIGRISKLVIFRDYWEAFAKPSKLALKCKI